MKIVEGRENLSKKTHPVSLEEGLELGEKLLAFIEEHGNAIGLAANQVGINKKVCVVNVIKPLILVNPEIVGQFGKVKYTEACLSFPGREVKTIRYTNIIVRDDNYGTVIYKPEGAERLLEIVCIQHEIDHLNGLTMHDRRFAYTKKAAIVYTGGKNGEEKAKY